MQKNLNLFINRVKLKKGSLIVRWLPFFIVLTSCSGDISEYGRVAQRSSMNKESFTFSVTQEYIDNHQNSEIDKNNPKMSKAESSLLRKLLKRQGYCLDKHGNTSFKVTSIIFASIIT